MHAGRNVNETHETQIPPMPAFSLATATAYLTEQSRPSGKTCSITTVHLSIRPVQPV